MLKYSVFIMRTFKSTLRNAGLILVFIFVMICTPLLGVFAQAQSPSLSVKTPQSSDTDTKAQPTLSVPEGKLPQSGINLTISPTFLNLLTDPGKKVSAPIKIKNNGNETEYMEIVLAKFEASEDGSAPKLIDIEDTDEFYQWISFSAPQFILAPNQTKTITVSITPAKTAGLGYYYGVIFRRIQEKQAGAGEAVITGAPAVSILLEVKSPHAKRELQLIDFTTDHLFYEYLPTTFNIKVKNTGNIHLIPGGDIFIDSLKQKQMAIIPLNPGRGNILPKTQRTFTTSWNDAMILRVPDEKKKDIETAKGVTTFKTTYDLAKADKFRIGKYTAHALLVYDNGERDVPLEATVSFWVVPWKLIGGAILIIISPLLIYQLIQKLRKRKK